ncbi:Sec-independent protein translocase subunit TatA [Propionimicrobium lymphophilum]|uniref:Sec-independent protein translocase subunit TatA n=1 Tax=Propionimicrobium lymphophilum TaxID=33012 RepID=UPI0004267B12|nr:Sec-independent protein translocase subunit TatA [Propionimicrobium lymphophilum]
MRPSHLIIIAIVIILLFGASKLPELARSLGKSAKILKSELSDLAEDDKAVTDGKDETKPSEDKE